MGIPPIVKSLLFNEAASAANASFMLSKSRSSTDTLSELTAVGIGPPAGDRDPPNESNS